MPEIFGLGPSSSYADVTNQARLEANLAKHPMLSGERPSEIQDFDLQSKRAQLLRKLDGSEYQNDPARAVSALLQLNVEMRDAAFDSMWGSGKNIL